MNEKPAPLPRVLPRSEHALSRKNIDPDALKVMVRLSRHGFKAYLVGGSVRDLLLGRTPKDFDIGTDAHPGEIRKLFRNCRIIGRRFRLAHILFREGKILEVSTFRRAPHAPAPGEGSEEAETRPGDNTFGEPHEDAARRDLTINGLFYDIASFSILDYVGGIEDLRTGIIRAIGEPSERFREDPLRMVRAVRHAVRLGFAIEKNTCGAIRRYAPLLEQSNSSRIQDEFQKDLDRGYLAKVLQVQHEKGLLRAYFRELSDYLERDARQRTRELFSPDWIRSALGELDAAPPPRDAGHRYRLASLLFPLVERRLLAVSPDRGDWVRNPGVTHDVFLEACAPLGLPRREREGLKALWGGWIRLLSALETEKIPFRLQRRPRFDEAMYWHLFHQTAAGIDPKETGDRLRAALAAGQSGQQAGGKRRRPRKRSLRKPG